MSIDFIRPEVDELRRGSASSRRRSGRNAIANYGGRCPGGRSSSQHRRPALNASPRTPPPTGLRITRPRRGSLRDRRAAVKSARESSGADGAHRSLRSRMGRDVTGLLRLSPRRPRRGILTGSRVTAVRIWGPLSARRIRHPGAAQPRTLIVIRTRPVRLPIPKRPSRKRSNGRRGLQQGVRGTRFDVMPASSTSTSRRPVGMIRWASDEGTGESEATIAHRGVEKATPPLLDGVSRRRQGRLI